jgi:ribosomal protein L14
MNITQVAGRLLKAKTKKGGHMRRLFFVLVALLALTSTAGAESVTMNVGEEYRGYVCRNGVRDSINVSVDTQSPGSYRVVIKADGITALKNGKHFDAVVVRSSIRTNGANASEINLFGNHTLIVQTESEIKVIVWPTSCTQKYKTIPVLVRVENVGALGVVSGTLKYANGSYVYPETDESGQVIYPVVVAYDVEGNFVDLNEVTEGKYSLTLPHGAYKLHFRFKDYDFWYPYSPESEASIIYLKTSKTTRSVTFATVIPRISEVMISDSGEYIIMGTGFGSAKGYVDFGGYITNSSTYILSWTDTEIRIRKPSNAIPTYIRVFAKGAGYSNAW